MSTKIIDSALGDYWKYHQVAKKRENHLIDFQLKLLMESYCTLLEESIATRLETKECEKLANIRSVKLRSIYYPH